MNINILRCSLLGIAGGQEVDYPFVNFIIYPLTMTAKNLNIQCNSLIHDNGSSSYAKLVKRKPLYLMFFVMIKVQVS